MHISLTSWTIIFRILIIANPIKECNQRRHSANNEPRKPLELLRKWMLVIMFSWIFLLRDTGIPCHQHCLRMIYCMWDRPKLLFAYRTKSESILEKFGKNTLKISKKLCSFDGEPKSSSQFIWFEPACCWMFAPSIRTQSFKLERLRYAFAETDTWCVGHRNVVRKTMTWFLLQRPRRLVTVWGPFEVFGSNSGQRVRLL
jgi:hypothetical protein